VADSQFRILATEVNTKLTAILTAEGRAIPEYVFASRKPFNMNEACVRVAWAHIGGKFVFETVPLNEGEATPITPPLGTRVAVAQVFIWHSSDEEAEHVLDRLWMATREVPSGRAFRWTEAVYEYPSEKIGEDLKSGVSVIRLTLPCDMPVSAVPTVPDTEVTVEDHDWKAGIENPPAEPEDESEYDVDRTGWVG
jgi:hypothetical protein